MTTSLFGELVESLLLPKLSKASGGLRKVTFDQFLITSFSCGRSALVYSLMQHSTDCLKFWKIMFSWKSIAFGWNDRL